MIHKKIGKPLFAFTLSEVLITLGIIGVVAALTMPSLIQGKQEKATVSRLKKVYSELSQAFLMVEMEYGDPTNWEIGSNTNDENDTGGVNLVNLFAKYMQVAKNCGNRASGKGGCFYSGSYYRLDNAEYPAINKRTDLGKMQLSDGTSIAFGGLSPDCSNSTRGGTKYLSSVCAWIIVDTNGYTRPNKYGVDTFEFSLSKYGIIPYGTAEDTSYSFKQKCTLSSAGNGCTAWVIYNENMDYLHCTGLEWGGKTKCK